MLMDSRVTADNFIFYLGKMSGPHEGGLAALYAALKGSPEGQHARKRPPKSQAPRNSAPSVDTNHEPSTLQPELGHGTVASQLPQDSQGPLAMCEQALPVTSPAAALSAAASLSGSRHLSALVQLPPVAPLLQQQPASTPQATSVQLPVSLPSQLAPGFQPVSTLQPTALMAQSLSLVQLAGLHSRPSSTALPASSLQPDPQRAVSRPPAAPTYNQPAALTQASDPPPSARAGAYQNGHASARAQPVSAAPPRPALDLFGAAGSAPSQALATQLRGNSWRPQSVVQEAEAQPSSSVPPPQTWKGMAMAKMAAVTQDMDDLARVISPHDLRWLRVEAACVDFRAVLANIRAQGGRRPATPVATQAMPNGTFMSAPVVQTSRSSA